MLAIADPSREETVGMLASLPSRTGQLQDRTQVGQDTATGQATGRTGHSCRSGYR